MYGLSTQCHKKRAQKAINYKLMAKAFFPARPRSSRSEVRGNLVPRVLRLLGQRFGRQERLWGNGQSAKTADWLSGNDVMSMFSRNCGCAKLRSSSVREDRISWMSFSFPEPSFLLVTWSAKRRALVAATTGCREISDIR